MFNNSEFSSRFNYKAPNPNPTDVLYDGNKLPKQGQVIYSDDYDARYNPRYILHKKKVYFSSLNKNNSSQTTSSFSVNAFTGNTKDIYEIHPIRVTVDYTVPATTITNAFVDFVDMDSHDYILGTSTKYHVSFPVTTGSENDDISFNHSFISDYVSHLKTPTSLKNELRVRIYKENATGGVDLFTDITKFSMEVEFRFQDHPFV